MEVEVKVGSFGELVFFVHAFVVSFFEGGVPMVGGVVRSERPAEFVGRLFSDFEEDAPS